MFKWTFSDFDTLLWIFYNCIFCYRVINTENSAVRNSIKDITLYRIYIYDLMAFVFLSIDDPVTEKTVLKNPYKRNKMTKNPYKN